MADHRAKTEHRTKSRRPRRREGGALKRVVDRNTQAVERIHRAIAGFPLVVLERIDRLERPVARVRKLQDRSISATYELVRGIEREVAQLVRLPNGARRRSSRNARAVRHAKPGSVAKGPEATARAS